MIILRNINFFFLNMKLIQKEIMYEHLFFKKKKLLLESSWISRELERLIPTQESGNRQKYLMIWYGF